MTWQLIWRNVRVIALNAMLQLLVIYRFALPVVSHSSLYHPRSTTPQVVTSSVVSERYTSVFLLLFFFNWSHTRMHHCCPLFFLIRMIFLCNCVDVMRSRHICFFFFFGEIITNQDIYVKIQYAIMLYHQ